MIVVRDDTGQIVFCVETPDDAYQRAEQHAKQIGGSVEVVNYSKGEKLAAEQNRRSKKEIRLSDAVINEIDGDYDIFPEHFAVIDNESLDLHDEKPKKLE